MKKKYRIFQIAVVLFSTVFIVGCANTNGSNSSASASTETQEAQKSNDEIDFENAFIVDVRTPGEYSSGYFGDAVNIPLDQLENELEQFKGHEQIVVYCRSGARSGQAKRILENNGFTNVINGINVSQLEKLQSK